MSIVLTLVGTKQAKPGLTFLHFGAVEDCNECKLFKVCQKLEPGRVYEIVKSRDIAHKCVVHEAGVTLVEVREATVLSTLDSRSCVPGAVIRYVPQKCESKDCEEQKKCNPLGIHEGDKCRIEEVVGRTGSKCRLGKQLAVVKLRRVLPT
jgi:uncharacterized protein (UPF0179 family)